MSADLWQRSPCPRGLRRRCLPIRPAAHYIALIETMHYRRSHAAKKRNATPEAFRILGRAVLVREAMRAHLDARFGRANIVRDVPIPAFVAGLDTEEVALATMPLSAVADMATRSTAATVRPAAQRVA